MLPRSSLSASRMTRPCSKSSSPNWEPKSAPSMRRYRSENDSALDNSAWQFRLQDNRKEAGANTPPPSPPVAQQKCIRESLLAQDDVVLQETLIRLLRTKAEIIKSVNEEEYRHGRLKNEKFALEVLINRLQLKCRWKQESARTTRVAAAALETATPYIAAIGDAIKKRIPQRVPAPGNQTGERVFAWFGSVVQKVQDFAEVVENLEGHHVQPPRVSEDSEEVPSAGTEFKTPLSSSGSAYDSDTSSESGCSEAKDGSSAASDSEGSDQDVPLIIIARVVLDVNGGDKVAELEVSATASPFSVAESFCKEHGLPKSHASKLVSFLIETEDGADKFPINVDIKLTDILSRA